MAYGRIDRVVLGPSPVDLVARLTERVPELADRGESAGMLDPYYVPTRYPNGLPGGTPFEAFNRGQAEEALASAEDLLARSRARVRGS